MIRPDEGAIVESSAPTDTVQKRQFRQFDDDDVSLEEEASSTPRCLPHLSRFQWTQLCLLASSFTMAFSSVTLIMSKAPLMVKGAGGSTGLGPVSIALYDIGKSFVVLPVGPLIVRHGRKNVFLFGCFLGLLSSLLGILGVAYSVPCLILLSTFLAGGATGIAYGYRFAAIEISQRNREFAATLCLSGGVAAAILGPVSAEISKDWFNLAYTGTYAVNTAFVIANTILVGFLSFPAIHGSSATEYNGDVEMESSAIEDANMSSPHLSSEHHDSTSLHVKDIIVHGVFIYATLFSIFSWVCMNIPMSTVGLAMQEVVPPISDTLQTTTFIAHFLGMFLPGLLSGRLIHELGFYIVELMAVAMFSTGAVLNIFAKGGEATLWILGQFCVGVAWNFGFSAATVMLSTSCPQEQRESSAAIQSYSDFVSFFAGGVITSSCGYVLDAGGRGGWRLLSVAQFIFIGIMLLIVGAAWRREKVSSS